MSVQYKPVIWDRNKMLYDAVLIIAVGLYIYLYLRVAPMWADWARPVDPQIQRMRAFGSCAFLMLTFILCIGPLARLDKRFLPLLYNRRHFGVLTCVVAASHAVYVLDWYYNFSPTPKYEALLNSNTSFGLILGFPFEALGIFAFAILVVLAVTSHDFWLSFLTPPVWKAIHMSVYVAYAAVVAHIALGYLQSAKNPTFAVIAVGGAFTVVILHLMAGRREGALDATASDATASDVTDWVRVGEPFEILPDRAKIVVTPDGERVAVVRHGDKISALSNVCAHQNGPLGEGRVIDGCLTCPWHGHQFRPEDGCAPAPFTDKVPTYRVKLENGVIYVDPTPNPKGTYVEPVQLSTEAAS
ncbi:MAG: Rieske 2Fe-2S domain-containing protein [Pseudomonadota bacterium]